MSMSDYTTIGSVQLPPDLHWIDEFGTGSDLVGMVVQTTITGALVIQSGAQQAGRLITLVGQRNGNEGYAPITRAQVDALRALAAAPGATYTLTFSDGRTFDVVFRRDGVAVEADPLRIIEGADDDDLYFPTIRLMQV